MTPARSPRRTETPTSSGSSPTPPDQPPRRKKPQRRSFENSGSWSRRTTSRLANDHANDVRKRFDLTEISDNELIDHLVKPTPSPAGHPTNAPPTSTTSRPRPHDDQQPLLGGRPAPRRRALRPALRTLRHPSPLAPTSTAGARETRAPATSMAATSRTLDTAQEDYDTRQSVDDDTVPQPSSRSPSKPSSSRDSAAAATAGTATTIPQTHVAGRTTWSQEPTPWGPSAGSRRRRTPPP